MTLRPTPSEERWLTLARRLRRSPRVAPFSEHTGGWWTANLPSRCTFFVLGLIAAGMIWVITEQLGPTGALVTAGLVSIAVAEWLIVARRHFWSGIEEALEVAGLTMLAFECISRVGSSSASVGARFVCAAFAIVGLRLLNPLFTTLSVLALVLTLDAPPLGAGLVCYGIGLAALVASVYRFRRPSNDSMLDWLIIVMPAAGYLWSASRSSLSVATDYLHAPPSAWVVPICPIVFAGFALVTGLWRRAHAPIMAAMLCVACSAYELRKLTGLSLEARLITWGCVLLLASIAIERYLRVPRGGITSRALREDGDSVGILAIVGSAVLTPQSPPHKATPSFEGGGGRFGGGGASGEY
jgi:hypothetical protein